MNTNPPTHLGRGQVKATLLKCSQRAAVSLSYQFRVATTASRSETSVAVPCRYIIGFFRFKLMRKESEGPRPPCNVQVDPGAKHAPAGIRYSKASVLTAYPSRQTCVDPWLSRRRYWLCERFCPFPRPREISLKVIASKAAAFSHRDVQGYSRQNR